ncbi:MAG: trypsin-like serine protease [Pseudomonadota bacterium]
MADTMIVAVEGYGLRSPKDGSNAWIVDATSTKLCEGAVLPFACSGFLSGDGATVTTASHCLENLSAEGARSFENRSILGLDIGETGQCTKKTALRLISGGAFYQGEGWFPSDAVHSCATVTRVSDDVVEILLSQPVLRLGRPSSLDDSPTRIVDLPAGRRVFGVGFSHTLLARQKQAGFLAPAGQCSATLANASLTAPLDPEYPLVGDYACSSIDTFGGDSGGPVMAIDERGESMTFIGVMSRAIAGGAALECEAYRGVGNYMPDVLGRDDIDTFNLVALLP